MFYRSGLASLVLVLWALAAPLQLAAQEPPDAAAWSDASEADPLVLTLEEAIQVALVRNHSLQVARTDVDEANSQVREAWGQIMPQVSANSDYTRNLRTPNPFAGSEAGGLFQSLGFMDWLSYNEQARTDEDPNTAPIPFEEFEQRRMQGMQEAGATLGQADNPFAVPNQVNAGITVSQTLYNASAFAAVRGAERLREINRQGVNREEQLLIDQVRQQFYQALLAESQASVARQSVERTQRTLEEARRAVAEGVAPVFQRLSTEVELSNLETEMTQAENQADLALDAFKNTLGMPLSVPVELRGSLQDVPHDPDLWQISVDDAVAEALMNRPDLDQARLAVELREIDRDITRGSLLPSVSAFANLNYVGNVPDDRQTVLSDPDDPFRFQVEERGFFNSSYWNPGVNVGLSLSWNIFDGYQSRAQVEQRRVAVRRAEIEQEQLIEAVHLEVEQALRNLETAQRRISDQEQNVEVAETNYQHAQSRLTEGVASPIEEREASQQLDQSRLNYLQALYDYVTALSELETAIGTSAPFDDESLFRYTRSGE